MMQWKGFVLLVVLGFLAHFGFDLAGQRIWAAWIFPVNESVWEHLKLGSVAMTGLLIYDRLTLSKPIYHLFTAWLSGYLLISSLVVAVFYGYHSLLHRVIVPVDIASFILGCWLSRKISLVLYRMQRLHWLNMVSLLAGLLLMALTVWYTFQPPRQGIFRDGPSGTYGYHRLK